MLAQRFLEDLARQVGLAPKRLTPDALAQLARYPWPGNIRELRNCMESLTLTSPRVEIDVADLPANVREVAAHAPEIRLAVGTRMEDAEREIIRRTVEAYPTLKEAARVLGIGLRTLHTKMGRYEIRRASRSLGLPIRQRNPGPDRSIVPERHSSESTQRRKAPNRHVLACRLGKALERVLHARAEDDTGLGRMSGPGHDPCSGRSDDGPPSDRAASIRCISALAGYEHEWPSDFEAFVARELIGRDGALVARIAELGEAPALPERERGHGAHRQRQPPGAQGQGRPAGVPQDLPVDRGGRRRDDRGPRSQGRPGGRRDGVRVVARRPRRPAPGPAQRRETIATTSPERGGVGR